MRISSPKILLTQLAVVIFVFAGLNCQKNTAPPPPPAKAEWDAGNKKMAEILKAHSEHADFLQIGGIIINDRGVEYFRKELAKADTHEVMNVLTLRARIASELLLDGKTDEAIHDLQSIMEGRDSTNPMYRKMKSLMALCYLRLGEQKNCISNHNSESCIYPIKGAGVYAITGPTLHAIELYTELCRDNPNDFQSRWLLNIAYMTLGQYPGKVPKEFYIPADHFDSDYKIPKFTDIAAQVGLDASNLAGGVVMEDFNNDGFLDLMLTQEAFDGKPSLFMNDGKGGFINKTKESGIEGEVAGRTTTTADYDNDGFVDVYICRGAWMTQEDNHWPNTLLHNNGNGTFSDVTEAAGLLAYNPSSEAAWADYDNDGFVDFYVGHETQDKKHPHPCSLYHNNGNGTFTDVAADLGVNTVGFIKSVAWGDYNNDGWMDLYVANIAGKNTLFKNNGRGADGKVTFTDVTDAAGVGGTGQSFPTFFFDFNNDGLPDILTSSFDQANTPNYLPMEYLGMKTDTLSHPKLYRNNGNGTFTNIAEQAGLGRLVFAMSIGFGDIDNDGFQDFYCGTGFLDLRFLFPNLMFRNNEGKGFQDVTRATGTGHLQKGHGIAFGDIDNDGDQDVFSMVGGGYSGDAFMDCLYLNPGNKNNWVTLRLEGKKSNRAALGSRVKVTVATAKGDREIYTVVANDASFAAGSLQQEIGLGQAKSIKSIEIRWQGSGATQTFANVSMDQFYHVTEGEGELTPTPRTKIAFNVSEKVVHHMDMKMP